MIILLTIIPVILTITVLTILMILYKKYNNDNNNNNNNLSIKNEDYSYNLNCQIRYDKNTTHKLYKTNWS